MRWFNVIFYVLILCMTITTANAQENINIICSNLIPNATSKTKYKEANKWEINNQLEWSEIEKSLNNLSPNKKIKSQQTVLNGKDEAFHISQKHNNLITGKDFYITTNGISEIITNPLHSFAVTDSSFRNFLENGLKNRFALSSKIDENVNINTAGIVIMYNGSSTLKNPMWLVSDPKELNNYINFIKKSQKLLPKYEQEEIKSTAYDEQDTFILYLNLPHAPARYITVTTAGNIRFSKVGISSHKNYLDDNNVFTKLKNIAIHK